MYEKVTGLRLREYSKTLNVLCNFKFLAKNCDYSLESFFKHFNNIQNLKNATLFFEMDKNGYYNFKQFLKQIELGIDNLINIF